MKTKNKQILFYAFLALIAAAAITLILVWALRPERAEPIAEPSPVPSLSEPDIQVVYKEKEVEKLVPVEVEKVITAKILQDGLNDMGFLVTQEYWFTEVMSFSSMKNFLGIQWSITESSFLASYDGRVTAGVDFGKIRITKNESAKTVNVVMPKPEILDTTIDTDSFKLYSEKEGLGNDISISDYNSSLSTLMQNAAQKAEDKGVLDKAGENAEKLIRDFIGGMIDTKEFTVNITEG